MVPALPVFDLAVLLSQLGQDEALAHMLVQSALQDFPAYWQQLESAIEQSALAQAQRSSHTLKGLCAQDRWTACCRGIQGCEPSFEAGPVCTAGRSRGFI